MRRVLAPALATLLTIAACGTLPQAPLANGGNAAAASQGRQLLPDALNLVRKSAEHPFREADRDNDGRLSATEADLPADVFAELDTNHDRWLSLGEMVPDSLVSSYMPVVEKYFRQLFANADRDRDGRLSPAERQDDEILGTMASDFRLGGNDRTLWSYDTLFGRVNDALLKAPDPMRAVTPIKADATPTLVVQGYLEPSYYFMYGIYRHLKKQGVPTYGINLFPNVSRASVQAEKVEQKIQEILKETGAKKINLVCHSFGGIISRYIIQKKGGFRYVDRYVSIATPHFGTAWCYLGPLGGACIDMRIGSDLLKELNQQTIWAPVKYGCIYTHGDEVAVPAKNCVLPGAKLYPPVPLTEHLLVLWSPLTYRYVDDSLQ